jgi:hypothetical protein
MHGTSPKYGWMVRSSGAVLAGSLFLLLSSSSAWADRASDRRATATLRGNTTTCSAIGFTADTRIGSSSNSGASDANVSGTVKTNEGSLQPGRGQEVDVAITGPPTVIVDAVVVKGADGYNTYSNPRYLPPTLHTDHHYIPPLDDGRHIPTISHWFACYHIDPGAATPEVPLPLAIPLAGGAILATWMFVTRRRRNQPAS